MVHFEFGQNFTFSEIIFQENQHFLKLSIIWFVWTADNTIPERGDILIPSKSTSVQKSKKRNRTSNTILVVKVPLRVLFIHLISDILSSSSLTTSSPSSDRPILFKPFLYDAKLPKFCVKYFFLLTGQILGVFGEFVCGNSWRAGRRSLKFIPRMLHVMPPKKLENDKFLRTALHCEFYIWNI